MLRSPSGRYHNWREIVSLLRARPGSWAVVLRDEPARLSRSIRDREHTELRLDDGVVEVRLVNRYRNNAGRERADVYLMFTQNGGSLDSEGES
jgi:hypothetical protein